MTPSTEVGAVISDLENEYERSRKFLADLCISLEKRGVLKRSGTCEDSCLVAKELDGPSSSIHDTAIITPFENFELREESSSLSVCSDGSTSGHLEPHISPSSHQLASRGTVLHSTKNQRNGDTPPLPASSPVARNRSSARTGKKPTAVFSSCPCIDPSAVEDPSDRAAVILESNGLASQRRSSIFGGNGGAPYLDGPAVSHALIPPPQPAFPAGRHRRSSLDFIPAPPSFHRKWLDCGGLTPSPSLSPPPIVPSGNVFTEVQPRPNPITKRGSLEVFGCPAAAATTAGVAALAPPATSGTHSCSGAAPAGAAARPASGILSRGGGPLGRRASLVISSQPIPIQTAPQQQAQLQPQLQQQQMELVGSPPVSSLIRTVSGMRAATESSGQTHLVGSPRSSIMSHLPPLAPAVSGTLPLALTSPGPRNAAVAPASVLLTGDSSQAAAAAAAAAAASGGGGGSGPLRRGSFNGVPPSGVAAGAPDGAAASRNDSPPSSSGDWRPRSGRFSRCCGAGQAVASAPLIGSPATASTAAAASASPSAGVTAMLRHGNATGRGDLELRSLSSSEVPEAPRLNPRYIAGLTLTGLGGGSSGGAGGGESPLSARGSCGSPLVRNDSGYRGSGNGEADLQVGAMSPRGAVSAPAATFTGGSGSSGGAAVAVAAGPSPVIPLHRQNSPHYHYTPHPPHHSLLQHLQLQHPHPHAHAHPASAAAIISPMRTESRTRLVPTGSQR